MRFYRVEVRQQEGQGTESRRIAFLQGRSIEAARSVGERAIVRGVHIWGLPRWCWNQFFLILAKVQQSKL